jgi:hypothetical protein
VPNALPAEDHDRLKEEFAAYVMPSVISLPVYPFPELACLLWLRARFLNLVACFGYVPVSWTWLPVAAHLIFPGSG